MSARAWMARRAAGRLRITDDTVRHLGALRHLGDPGGARPLREALPEVSRTALRALRTHLATPVAEGWVWPHWLERQLDPESPAFVPQGHLPLVSNLTERNWTAVGNLDSPWEAIVDPRGLVTPAADGWSLDWWIGAEDRWHLPSRSVAVRQRLVDATPVVETAMRVPGGDAVQRVYGVQRSSQDGGGELVVVEVENRSKVPVALVLAVRPYNPEGLATVERIDLRDGTVTVDGEPALLLPRPPARSAGSTFRGGDSAAVVTGGAAPEEWAGPVRCPAGMAQAAFVHPLAHGATFRAVLPRPADAARRGGSRRRRRTGAAPGFPSVVPGSSDVAQGWAAQTRRGTRLELPDGQLAEAVEANRRFLLLLHDGDTITPGPATYHRFWFRDAAYMLDALDCFGFHEEVATVLAGFPERQRPDGFFHSQSREWDANGAALWALQRHWRLTRDRALVEAVVDHVAHGVQWIEQRRTQGDGARRGLWRTRSGSGRGRGADGDGGFPGLLPPGESAEHLGPPDRYYWDDLWGVAGLRAGAELLAAAGQPEAAEDAAGFARSMWADLEGWLDRDADRLGTRAMPAGPRRSLDRGAIGSLAAAWPLELLGPDDDRVAATLDILRERFTLADGRAFYQGISHRGLGTYLTLQLAGVELQAGDSRCLDRLGWFLEAATPTWTWPEAIHPGLAGGCMGDGHHGWAAAELLRFVRHMLVREVTGGLALAGVVPRSWLGQGWEVHGAPTAHGRLSYAVRWHGERPALLWELEPHEPTGAGPADDGTGVTLTAPGLDSSWSAREPRGEALLAPYPLPPEEQ